MPKPVYDTATRKVVMKEGEKGSGTPSEKGERTWFQVSGEVRDTILQFAKEDGIDVSSKAGQGRAINTYIRAWVGQGLEERKKLPGQATAEAIKVPSFAPLPATPGDGPKAEAAQPRGPGGRFGKRR